MKLKSKLILGFLGISLIPLALLVGFSLSRSSQALMRSAFNQLEAVRSIKQKHIETYFDERIGDIFILSENPYTLESYKHILAVHERSGYPSPGWNERAEDLDPFFRNYIETYGYYDFFFFDLEGNIIYTAAREDDLGAKSKMKPVHHMALPQFHFFSQTLQPFFFGNTNSIDGILRIVTKCFYPWRAVDDSVSII